MGWKTPNEVFDELLAKERKKYLNHKNHSGAFEGLMYAWAYSFFLLHYITFPQGLQYLTISTHCLKLA